MKKRGLVLILSAVILVVFAGHAFGSLDGSYSGFPIVKIVVNGQEIRGDVPGVILSGRTMVPVRFVSEALGADVTWDQATLTVGITS